MNEIDLLLSDEFVEFSSKVKELHEKKKSKQNEFKTLYDKFKAEVQTMDDEAKALQVTFDDWKNSQLKGKVTAQAVESKVPGPVLDVKNLKS